MTGLWQWLTGLPALVLGVVILLGTILSAGGGFLALVRQSKISEAIRKQAEENVRRTEENLDQTREVLKHMDEVLAQNQEIIKRGEETLLQITGGDGYCYFIPSSPYVPGPKQHFTLVVKGQYPLYDLVAHIENSQEAEPPVLSLTTKEYFKGRRILRLGNVNSAWFWSDPEWAEWDLGSAGGWRQYIITFVARNGSFRQFLNLTMVAGGYWAFFSRVQRDGKVIEGSEDVSHNFPRDDRGQPQR